MTLADLHTEIGKYLHIEDTGAIDIVLASSIATRLGLGNPVWMILVGVSSSGKSQIIRPLSYNADKFVHRVDDLTENTLISGSNAGSSLLFNIGKRGMILISDLTAIFSKSAESRDAILGQLRLVYDGELTKHFGNQKEPLVWEGSLGIVAGCTPSVYRHFEYIADMGERFIYYRMKEIDPQLAVEKALSCKVYGKELDHALGALYDEYLRSVCIDMPEVPHPSAALHSRILRASLFASRMRTPVHLDQKTGEVDRIPFPEMPMRVALQLLALTRGLMAMQWRESGDFDLQEEQIRHIEWCAYSLANEERRACLRTLAAFQFDDSVSTQRIADKVGLSTAVTKIHLQILSAIGVIQRNGDGNTLAWRFSSLDDYHYVRALEDITITKDPEQVPEVSDDDGFGGL